MISLRSEVFKRKLLKAFDSSSVFPIDLEWMVELFKYKHISSLTTHLKRHFREKKEYLKRPDGHGTKKSWRYHITIEAFRKICHFCRHSERKVVAKYWLKKLALRDKIRPPSHHHQNHHHHPEYDTVPNSSNDDDGSDTATDMDEVDSYDETTGDYTGDESFEDSSTEEERKQRQNTKKGAAHPATPALSSSSSSSSIVASRALTPSTTKEPQRYGSNNSNISSTVRSTAPSVAYPFRRYHHEWNYLGLLPMNPFLLSFYHPYSHAHHYSTTPNNGNRKPTYTSHFSIDSSAFSRVGAGGDEDGMGVEKCELDSSFDTNAFLSFSNDGSADGDVGSNGDGGSGGEEEEDEDQETEDYDDDDDDDEEYIQTPESPAL